MPIEPGRVMPTGFVVFEAQTSLAQVYASPEYPQAHYVVVSFDDGRFAILSRPDLDALRHQAEAAGQGHRLMAATLARLTRQLAVAPLLASDDHAQALAQITAFPGRRAVVLNPDGSLAGLLFANVFRSTLNADASLVAALLTALAEEPLYHLQAEAVSEQRFINVEVRDEQNTLYDVRRQPLQRGRAYTLIFDVDLSIRQTATAGTPLDIPEPSSPSEAYETLTVRLTSSDFELSASEKQLFLPRRGKSLNQVDFIARPLHDGPAVIQAVFLRGNNFVQAWTLRFHVGDLFAVETAGRPLEAALSIPPRDVNLTILKLADGFQMILTGAVAATAVIPLTLPQLDQMVAQLRQALLEVIHLEEQGVAVYLEGVDIPLSVSRTAALRLAREGHRLYQRVFFGPAADQQCKNLGRQLRALASRHRLQIQIFSKEFSLPWSLLYLAEQPPLHEDQVDLACFLGMQHIVEQIPLQPDMAVLDNTIDARQGLAVGVHLNADIDAEMGLPLVAEQERYWARLAANRQAAVAVRRTSREVLHALADPATPDQILYFYCHAVSRSLAEGQGPDASRLELTGKDPLTLGELAYRTSSDALLPGQPLVFINACQSAELSPLFYDGFVPYFMSKGARGVIGTECDTPAVFAKEWALRFFDRLLAGKPLGEIVHELRWEFCRQHNNLLGLLYAVYVDGDTHLVY